MLKYSLATKALLMNIHNICFLGEISKLSVVLDLKSIFLTVLSTLFGKTFFCLEFILNENIFF